MTAVAKIGPSPRIVVEHAGAGEFVVFLHGIGGNRRNWSEQIAAFARYFHAAAWDARGYGDSDDYDGPLVFSDYADDLARVLDHFGATKAHVVGLSMGGRIAMDFAAQRPARLKTLVLCDTHKGFAGWSEEKKRAFIAARKDPLVAGKEPKDIAESVARSLVAPNASPAALAQMSDSMSRLHKASYIKSIETSVMMPVRDDLHRIAVPTLVLVGAEDRLTPLDMARAMAAEIPGAEFVVIDGAGHLPNIEQPAAFNTTVLAFLRRHVG